MNNNFTIEGVDNNNKGVTGPLVYVPTDATAEFTLLQNQYNAEFGHSTGGQFNTVVKSGTNRSTATSTSTFRIAMSMPSTSRSSAGFHQQPAL